MGWPEYDPGKAANILSLLAFLVSIVSLWRGERARSFVEHPDIDARLIPETPDGLISVSITVANNSPTLLQLDRIEMVSPRYAMIVSSGEFARWFWQARPVETIDKLPARSQTFENQLMAPSGNDQDTTFIRFLITYDGPRPGCVRFNVVCIVRPSDQRRRRRIVNRQMLTLTTVRNQVVQGDDAIDKAES